MLGNKNNNKQRNISISPVGSVENIHKCFTIENKTIIVLSESIVQKLGIDDETYFEEIATADGIFLKRRNI